MKKTKYRDSIRLNCTLCIERLLQRKVMNNAILLYPRFSRKGFVSKHLLVVSVGYFSLIFRREVSAWQNVTVTNETLGELSIAVAEPVRTP